MYEVMYVFNGSFGEGLTRLVQCENIEEVFTFHLLHNSRQLTVRNVEVLDSGCVLEWDRFVALFFKGV